MSEEKEGTISWISDYKETPPEFDEYLGPTERIQTPNYDIMKGEDNPRDDEGGKEMDANKFDVFMQDIKDDARERDKRYREDMKEQRELFQKQLDEYKQDSKEREERMEKREERMENRFNRIDDKLDNMNHHVQSMADNNRKHNLTTTIAIAAIVITAIASFVTAIFI